MTNLGIAAAFKKDKEEAPVIEETVPVSYEEAQACINDATTALEEFTGSVDEMSNLLIGQENLKHIVATIEEYGIERSLKSLHGEELVLVAPSMADEEADKDKVLGELVVATEGIAKQVIATIKAIIAKIAEFIKRLFSNATKMAKAIKAGVAEAKKSKKEAADIEAVTITGYDKAGFEATLKIVTEAELQLIKVLKAYAEDKDATNLVALFSEASESNKMLALVGYRIKVTDDGSFVVEKVEGPKREAKTLKELGFKAEDCSKYAAKVALALGASKGLEKVRKQVELTTLKAAAAAAKKEDATLVDTAGAAVVARDVSKYIALVGKLAMQLGAQQIAMLKACVSPVPAKEDLGEGEENVDGEASTEGAEGTEGQEGEGTEPTAKAEGEEQAPVKTREELTAAVTTAQTELGIAVEALDSAEDDKKEEAQATIDAAKAVLTAAKAELEAAPAEVVEPEAKTREVITAELDEAQTALQTANSAFEAAEEDKKEEAQAVVDAAKATLETVRAEFDALPAAPAAVAPEAKAEEDEGE